jgi:hypothetical protein
MVFGKYKEIPDHQNPFFLPVPSFSVEPVREREKRSICFFRPKLPFRKEEENQILVLFLFFQQQHRIASVPWFHVDGNI